MKMTFLPNDLLQGMCDFLISGIWDMRAHSSFKLLSSLPVLIG